MNIEIPEKLHPLYTTKKRFIDIYGGRGGSKSHGIGTFLLCRSRMTKIRSLCCREIQNSIKDSVWQLLVEKINYYRFYF
jgi:phage terminase large subunit